MTRTKGYSRAYSRLGLLFFVVILLGAGGWTAKKLYTKLKAPAVYKTTENLPLTTPATQTTQTQSAIPKEPGKKALLPGATWVPQTFNNCGPATTSMVLQYFGFTVSQNDTKAKLRTNDDDKNVFTYEIADYMRKEYGVESKLLYGGDIQLLKKLIANGFYVVVEDWLHPNEDIGHVTIIRGFDDEQGVLIADDSYIGVNITYPYEQFDKTQWKAFNREYLPVYKAGSEPLLRAIVGQSWDKDSMYAKAAQTARAEITQNENDMYAWFNLGTSLYGLGNYKEAKTAFEKSRTLGWPKRMLWYQIQPIQTLNQLGDYQKALELTGVGLAGNDSFAELHLEAAIAYKGLGNIDQAKKEAEKALFYAPSFTKAADFLASL
jgi:tetratricopeptide (TPR) repeat protein